MYVTYMFGDSTCLDRNTVILLIAVEISNRTVYFLEKLLSILLTSIRIITLM